MRRNRDNDSSLITSDMVAPAASRNRVNFANQDAQQPTETDLWWSNLQPQRSKNRFERQDSISIGPETTVDLEEHCVRCYRRHCPCFCQPTGRRLMQSYLFVSDVASDVSYDATEASIRQDRQRKLCLATFVSLMVGFILFSKAYLNDQWFINVGGTRFIHTSWLSRQVTFTVPDIKTSKLFQLYVFQTERYCPSLSLDQVVFQNNQTLDFHQTEYAYNYFYLNPGSEINVNLFQEYGSSNVYLLRGKNMVQRVRNDVYQDNRGGFQKQALEMRALSAGNSTTIMYKTALADDYILVYESGSKKTGRLRAQYKIQATTYDSTQAKPVCGKGTDSKCTITLPLEKACVLVWSKPLHEKYIGEQVSIVAVSGKPRLGLLCCLSSLPLLLAWACTCKLQRRQEYEPIGDITCELEDEDAPDRVVPVSPYSSGNNDSPIGTKFLADATPSPLMKPFGDVSCFHAPYGTSPSSIVNV